MSGDMFDCHNRRRGVAAGRVEGRDATKHPTVCRTAPHNKESPGFNCAETEKPWPKSVYLTVLFVRAKSGKTLDTQTSSVNYE